jgi:hypothetical protein
LSLYLQGGLEPIMPVDRKWMYETSRLAPAFFENVTKFVGTAKRHCAKTGGDANVEHDYITMADLL